MAGSMHGGRWTKDVRHVPPHRNQVQPHMNHVQPHMNQVPPQRSRIPTEVKNEDTRQHGSMAACVTHCMSEEHALN